MLGVVRKWFLEYKVAWGPGYCSPLLVAVRKEAVVLAVKCCCTSGAMAATDLVWDACAPAALALLTDLAAVDYQKDIDSMNLRQAMACLGAMPTDRDPDRRLLHALIVEPGDSTALSGFVNCYRDMGAGLIGWEEDFVLSKILHHDLHDLRRRRPRLPRLLRCMTRMVRKPFRREMVLRSLGGVLRLDPFHDYTLVSGQPLLPSDRN